MNTHLRAASFFFLANILTGLLNYLFQIQASKLLSSSDFANLNAWFANLAVLFFFGGILQYYGIFFPLGRSALRKVLIAFNFLGLAMVLLWFQTPDGQGIERSLIIFVGTTLIGWMLGQVQYRKMFLTLGLANLIMSSAKIAYVNYPLVSHSIPEVFRFALFIGSIPALWMVTAVMWPAPDLTQEERPTQSLWQLWSAPIVLSLAGCFIPQMDMILISHFQSSEFFESFAHASLFSRGIYFIFLIFAQWLLPYQLRGELKATRKVGFSLLLGAAAVVCSVLITLAAPYVVTTILKWDHTPPAELIFLASLNMTLLTWIFLLIQRACARGMALMGAVAMASLALEATLQSLLLFQNLNYFIFGIAVQAILVCFLNSPEFFKRKTEQLFGRTVGEMI